MRHGSGEGAAPAAGRASAAQRGQATVEFALVLIVLLAVLLAAIDFGSVVYDRIDIGFAAEAGARAGALAGQSASQAVEDAEAAAQTASAGLVRCPLSQDTANYGTEYPGQVTVQLTCTYQPLTPLGALLGDAGLSDGLTLTATGMRMIEP